MYSFTLSLTSALEGVGGQRFAPVALPPGMTRYPLYRRMGGPQGFTSWLNKERQIQKPGNHPKKEYNIHNMTEV